MTSEERPWILGAHIGTLIGYTVALGSFLVPLFIWLTKKDESALITEHAKASLNFQISMAIYFIFAGLLAILVIGIPFLIIIPLVNLICVILATIEADKGNLYSYPFTIKFVK